MAGSWFFVVIAALSVLPRAGAVALTHDASPASGTQRAAPPASYSVGAADVLKITVVDEPRLSGSFKVDTDGTITYPLLGRVVVRDLSVQRIEEELTKRLQNGFVRRPQVLVEVEEYRSRAIYILGEVKQTGKYGLQGDMTLLEMLALAGSVTPSASSEVRVLRKRAGSATESAALPGEGDTDEVARINLDDLKTGKLVGNVLLQDGDTIYVPAVERFFVSGHVRSPGAYDLKYRGLTVQQAITLAGGLSERGSNRGIKIRRQFGPNQFKEIDVKLTDEVKPNDMIIIRHRFI